MAWRTPFRSRSAARLEIAAFLAGISASGHRLTLQPTVVNGSPALLAFEHDQVTTVLALGIRDGRITTIDAVRNPHKFHGLRHLSAGD